MLRDKNEDMALYEVQDVACCNEVHIKAGEAMQYACDTMSMMVET